LLLGDSMRAHLFPSLSTFCLSCFALACLSVFPAAAAAETAYKWTDQNGRVFFGTKPPPGANNVATVRAKNYSRYSPSKALAVKKGARDARGRLDTVKEHNIPLPEHEDTFEVPSGKKKVAKSEEPLRIEPVSLKFGKGKEIISCFTTIKNRSGIDVDGIQVSFEFSDGTLILADGPSRLNGSTGAVYSVRSENLPIQLAAGSSSAVKVLVNTDEDAKADGVSENSPLKE